jgi:hypothetical protein
MKSFVIKFAAAVCVLSSFGAVAEVTNSDVKKQKLIASASSFATLDRNGDHRISRSEAGFDRLMSETFADIDTNGDGFVSAAEYAAAEKTRNAVSSNLPPQ